MHLLARLAAIIASTAIVASGVVVGVSVAANGAATHLATSQAAPLAALGSKIEEASTIYASDGVTVLATLRGPELRQPVKLAAVPQVLIHAVLDTEDQRFYIHGGFDVPSTLRALASDSSAGGLQGGSTITQQLVKQIYLSSQRKISRKIKEAVLAERLQQHYSKNQILEAYLNTIYLGSGAYGVQAASTVYFDQSVSALTLPDAALLAGLIQDPSGYDPISHPAPARTRRAEVLARMVHYGDITQAQADAANASALPTSATPPSTLPTSAVANSYVATVRQQLLGSNSPLGSTYQQRYQAVYEGGLKIVTNLNLSMTASATATVAADTPRNSSGFQEALVSIEPSTGRVMAMVGGVTGATADYNVITDGSRQPGSGFKLYTLAAALSQGYTINDTINAQAPCAIGFPGPDGGGFLPPNKPATNDEGPGSGGIMTLTTATALSMNCGFLRLAHEVGLPAIAAMAKQLGVTAKLAQFPSMVLGADEVRPLDIASSYAAIAADGVYHNPSFIDTITDRTGQVIYRGVDTAGHRVVSAQVARETTAALTAVVTSGTGSAAQLYNRPVAGKTGTTSNTTDAWFNGFAPQLETTVWMGSPTSNQSVRIGGVGVYGGTYPAHTWRDYMNKAVGADPVIPFVAPAPTRGKYITSPALTRDDHSTPAYGSRGATGTGAYRAPITGTGTAATRPAVTTPATAVTSPPAPGSSP